jgi:uncharacterized protein
VTTTYDEGSVLFDGPEKSAAFVVLGHGAGAGMKSDFMETIAQALGSRGIRVCRFNFPYMEQGRKAPDRQPVLEEAFERVVQAMAPKGRCLVLGGKSLGGRIASHVAAGVGARGLVFLGYPLHPPGRPDRIRDAHLKDLDVPMLFVEGTRDPFCPLETLDRVRAGISHSDLTVIQDGDHSLKVRKSSGRSTEEAWAEAAGACADWINGLCE